MKRKIILLLISILILSGCENKEEELKKEYIEIKKDILEQTRITEKEKLPLDITVKIDREEEKIKYKVILNHPKENMKEIKAMVVHNYYNENLFPSIGIFDDKKELLVDKTDTIIELEDTIESTKSISDLELEIKVWIEYKNDLGKKVNIFYKTT